MRGHMVIGTQEQLDQIIKQKENAFGLKYYEQSDEYKSYHLFYSMRVESYSDYRHHASYYGLPVLKKDQLFKWFRMFFEVNVEFHVKHDDSIKWNEQTALKCFLPKESGKISKKQVIQLKSYVKGLFNECKADKIV